MNRDLNTISDDTLRKTLLAHFAASDSLGFANLRVGVVSGIVHLAGVVPSLEVRVSAAEIASGIEGVRGVVNRIEAPGAPSPARTVNLNLEDERGNKHE